MSDDYVMQIKNIGLREGVFVRRYQLTGEYGNSEHFTPEMLQSYIKRVLEPNYLFIQHAYDLGMQNENSTAQKIKDYKINLLANNHPIKFEQLTILKNDLRDLYARKKIKYDIVVIQTSSFSSADSLYKLLQNGGELQHSKREFEQGFPQIRHFDALLYGEQLHPELFPLLESLNAGECSAPVYTGSMWSILKMNKKSVNRNLTLFENYEQELLAQAQALFKYRQQKELVENLSQKYHVSVQIELYPLMVDAFQPSAHGGRIVTEKIKQSDLAKVLIYIDNNDVSLSTFITSFNQASSFLRLAKLSENDLHQFVADYIAQHVLYLDALEKGVHHNTLIKDKLENKEHRILLTKYLKEELAQKIRLSEKEARAYYKKNRDKWQGQYSDVASNIKSELKGKKLQEKKEEIIEKLHKKYKVRYNEQLLKNIADQLTSLKRSAAGEKHNKR